MGRGFQNLPPEKRKEIAAKGGRAQSKWVNPGNFANNPDLARKAGRMGAKLQGRHNNPGNFANNRARASEAGRKGRLK